MHILLLFFSLLICKVRGGELLITEIPSSIELQDDGTVNQSFLPEFFSAVLGFTTQEDLGWKGVKIIHPFNFAEALVVLNINGIDSLGNNDKIRKYELNNDESSYSTWRKIQNRLTDRYPMENLTMEYMNFPQTENINEMGRGDLAFLSGVKNLEKYSEQIKKVDGTPGLYWFNIDSGRQISGHEGKDMKNLKDRVLKSFLKLSNKFNSMYKGSAIVVAIVNDMNQLRKTRSIPNEKLESSSIDGDLRNNVYDPDFPVIFNIILWFTIALIFSLLAVSVFIASMDPGRDSIIYRMTSNRMKKDS